MHIAASYVSTRIFKILQTFSVEVLGGKKTDICRNNSYDKGLFRELDIAVRQK